MSGMPAFSVVVPCYNEAAGLAALLEAFDAAGRDSDFELILVDNGSTDGTAAELARLLPRYPFARSVKVDVNRGYGFGILNGLAASYGRAVGWVHADLQFDPAAVFRAALLLERAGGRRVLVKGLRRGRPLSDRFFTAGMALFESLCLGVRLRDVNGQPTLFDRALLDTWTSPPHDFSLDLYAYASARLAGYAEVRFDVETRPRYAGVSTWNRGLGDRLALSWRNVKAGLAMRAALRRDA